MQLISEHLQSVWNTHAPIAIEPLRTPEHIKTMKQRFMKQVLSGREALSPLRYSFVTSPSMLKTLGFSLHGHTRIASAW